MPSIRVVVVGIENRAGNDATPLRVQNTLVSILKSYRGGEKGPQGWSHTWTVACPEALPSARGLQYR